MSDAFGNSVALVGNTVIIGAPWNDDFGIQSGSAYVFQFDGRSWIQRQKILPTDGQAGDLFGQAVAFDGETILIGAPRDDDVGSSAGAVYAFHWSPQSMSWVQTQKFYQGPPVFGGFQFGSSISMSTASDGTVWAIIGPSQASRAWLFRNDLTGWTYQQTLLPTIPGAGNGSL